MYVCWLNKAISGRQAVYIRVIGDLNMVQVMLGLTREQQQWQRALILC